MALLVAENSLGSSATTQGHGSHEVRKTFKADTGTPKETASIMTT